MSGWLFSTSDMRTAYMNLEADMHNKETLPQNDKKMGHIFLYTRGKCGKKIKVDTFLEENSAAYRGRSSKVK